MFIISSLLVLLLQRSLLQYFVPRNVVLQKVSHEVCDDYGYGAHSYHHGYHDRSDTDSEQ